MAEFLTELLRPYTIAHRRAYELAFATTYSFGGCRPHFVMVDEVTFSRPVDVGDLLKLNSRVLYSTPESVGVDI